jgi:hypothetical protein
MTLAAAVIASVCEAIQGMKASGARPWIAGLYEATQSARRHREARSAVAIQESLPRSDE